MEEQKYYSCIFKLETTRTKNGSINAMTAKWFSGYRNDSFFEKVDKEGFALKSGYSRLGIATSIERLSKELNAWRKEILDRTCDICNKTFKKVNGMKIHKGLKHKGDN